MNDTALTNTSPTARWRMPAFVQGSAWLHVGALAATAAEPALWPYTLGAIVANHAAITTLGLLPRTHALGGNWTRLPTTADVVALTIDDGPDPEVTPRVLDLLDAHHAKATFFCFGTRVKQQATLAREIIARGHALENHSEHHRHHFSLLGYRGYLREIGAAQDSIAQVTGIAPRYFRAPAGLRNVFLDPALHTLQLQLVSWTRRGFDTRERNADRVTRRLVTGLSAGDILLLHDGHAARTADGTPVILRSLPAVLAAVQNAGLQTTSLREFISCA